MVRPSDLELTTYLVQRRDGEEMAAGSQLFVLDYGLDPEARAALLHYCDLIETIRPHRAALIRAVVNRHGS